MRVQTLSTACLTEAPPPLPDAGDLFDACEGWEACITFENAGKLAKYLRATQKWMRQAHLACSENPQQKGENNHE